MPLKLSYNQVKENIESLSFKVLSIEYENSRSKLLLKCVNNHQWYACYSDIIHKKNGCPYCAGNAKLSYEQVKESIKNLGFILLSTEYINSQTKILLKCKFGHTWYAKYSHLINEKSGCPHCAGNAKFSYEQVKETIENLGYKLVSKEYINSQTKLDVECKFGHIFSITYNNLVNNGRGCSQCHKLNNRGETSPNWKGGKQLIDNYLRDYISEWKKNILVSKNYTCQITGKVGGRLHVHHASENFINIRDKVISKLGLDKNKQVKDYTEEEINNITNLFLAYHDSITAECINKDVHNLFHSLYTRHNNTYEQYLEFKQRYNDGEFKDLNL